MVRHMIGAVMVKKCTLRLRRFLKINKNNMGGDLSPKEIKLWQIIVKVKRKVVF